MDTQILEDIGLTNAEIKVYLALLELGSSTAGHIIEKSNLQSSVVFMTLGKLTEKGFVSSVKEGKRSHYQASNPKHITEYIDEKKTRFERILPQLLAKQAMPRDKQDVTLFRGIRGVREVLYEFLDAGGTEHHTLGSPKESLMMGEAFWVTYHKKRVDKGISAKLLFNESLRSWASTGKYIKKYTEIKYTKQGFEPLTEIIIRNDKVGIIIWTEKPTGVLLHNRVLAESYEKFFELLWKTARS